MGGVVNAISEGVKHVGGQLGEGLKHIGGEINKSPLLNIATGGITGGLMREAGRAIAPEEEAAIAKPGEDPRMTELRRQQMLQAKEFRQNMPSLQEKAFGNVAARENARLGQEVKGIQASSNRRGLLYSGLREGQESGAKAASASNLAGQRMSINDAYEQKAKQMEMNAMDTAFKQQQSQQQIEDEIYNQALANVANKNAATSALIGAGGQLAGRSMGGGK